MKDKTIKPPYTSYKSFETLIGELRSHEVLPDVIDRSLALLRKRSGSEQAALIATLKWFKLIDTNGGRTPLLDQYIAAGENEAKVLMKKMVEDSYSAITDGTFNLKTATTQQMTDRFRAYEISGSTLSKCIGFFLAASKDAGIQVSPHVKAPPVPTTGTAKRKPKAIAAAQVALATPDTHPAGKHPRAHDDSMLSIPIPISGKDGAILLPKNMTDKQWTSVVKMIEFIINNYRETMVDAATEAAEGDDNS